MVRTRVRTRTYPACIELIHSHAHYPNRWYHHPTYLPTDQPTSACATFRRSATCFQCRCNSSRAVFLDSRKRRISVSCNIACCSSFANRVLEDAWSSVRVDPVGVGPLQSGCCRAPPLPTPPNSSSSSLSGGGGPIPSLSLSWPPIATTSPTVPAPATLVGCGTVRGRSAIALCVGCWR